MNNHLSNYDILHILLENCTDEISKDFLMKYADRINRDELCNIYDKYVKTENVKFTNVKCDCIFNNIKFKISIN